MPFANLASGTSALAGDPVYLVGRLGKAGNRSAYAQPSRIITVLDKPRLLFVLEPTMFEATR